MTKVYHSSKKDTWRTPPELFNVIANTFGSFDLDAAATDGNSLCVRHLDDAFIEKWDAVNVWCNPPYGKGQASKWISRAKNQIESGNCFSVVMLLPARPGTKWWREHVLNESHYFITSRVKFLGADSSAPFPSVLIHLVKGNIPAIGYFDQKHGIIYEYTRI